MLYFLVFSKANLHCFCFIADLATVVGYLVVSRPFLNLAHPRHLNSTHSELLEVRAFHKNEIMLRLLTVGCVSHTNLNICKSAIILADYRWWEVVTLS